MYTRTAPRKEDTHSLTHIHTHSWKEKRDTQNHTRTHRQGVAINPLPFSAEMYEHVFNLI